MSKYNPLSARLAGHKATEWKASFAELEEVLGFPLPKSARTGRTWWKADAGSHARSWTDGGWSAEAVDPTAGHVTFRRATPLAAPAAPPPEPVPEKAPLALGEEPAILKSLETPKWHTALIAGGLAIIAGGAVLAIGSVVRKRGEKD